MIFRRVFATLVLLAAASAVPAQPTKSEIEITVQSASAPLPTRILSPQPELLALAQMAFGAHGRYQLVNGGERVRLTFTGVAPNQVRVDLARRDGSSAGSQVFQGSSNRQALLRAADWAVEQTNGLGLKGWFASRLAFIGERTGHTEVYTGDLFFGEVKQITNDKKQALTPRLSPDGRRLLYTSYYRTFPDIYEIDLGSYQRNVIASFKGTNTGGRYSPDGSQIAMVLTGQGNPDIYVADSRGRGARRRTTSPAVEASPCWSPDGSRLVFTSDAAGGPQLYVMPAAGGTPSRIVAQHGYCAEPDWSRGNPNKLAFTVRSGRGFQIAVYDFATRGAAEIVSRASLDAVLPVWLADGRHLVYTARQANQRALYILDTVTKKSVRISPAAFGSASQASVQAP